MLRRASFPLGNQNAVINVSMELLVIMNNVAAGTKRPPHMHACSACSYAKLTCAANSEMEAAINM
jgi:hypothetical protein